MRQESIRRRGAEGAQGLGLQEMGGAQRQGSEGPASSCKGGGRNRRSHRVGRALHTENLPNRHGHTWYLQGCGREIQGPGREVPEPGCRLGSSSGGISANGEQEHGGGQEPGELPEKAAPRGSRARAEGVFAQPKRKPGDLHLAHWLRALGPAQQRPGSMGLSVKAKVPGELGSAPGDNSAPTGVG